MCKMRGLRFVFGLDFGGSGCGYKQSTGNVLYRTNEHVAACAARPARSTLLRRLLPPSRSFLVIILMPLVGHDIETIGFQFFHAGCGVHHIGQ
jgi:hypothetical protein